MPEIMLRDLCRWDRRLAIIPPIGMTEEVALDRGVSWAASIRTAPPLLASVRGDELVVLPLRMLEQIELGDAFTREELLADLSQRNIAAILTEPGFSEEPLAQIPILTLPAPFPHDAEGTLNRLITEKRAELYRLGAELSRRLSQVIVDPRGISALLAMASDMTKRPLLLEDGNGNVVASSDEPPPPSGQRLVSRARVVDGALMSVEEHGTEFLIVALAAGGRSEVLSMSGESGSLTESDRLVLLQTAGMCSALLGQTSRLTSSDRTARERQVADLLLGRLATSAATLARGQALGISPNKPVVVGLIESDEAVPNLIGARDLVARAFGGTAAENLAITEGAVGLLLSGIDHHEAKRSLERALERTSNGGGLTIALSNHLPSVIEAPAGLREARFALDLRRRGAITPRIISCASVDDLGLYRLLYPLWGNPVVSSFLSDLLGALEEYDGRRKAALIPTLDAYLAAGGALSEAATHLGIHRNTLSYRLQRIEELTGRDLSQPNERLLLEIALMARRMPFYAAPGRPVP